MEAVGDIRVIPQVFYDVIARIIPGAVAIWALMSASNRKAEVVIKALFYDSAELENSTFVLVLTFLVLAYLFGHFISALSDFLFFKWILKKPLRSFSKALRITREELCNSHLQERVDQLIEETVGKADRIEDVRLQKPIRTEREVAAFYIWYDRARVLNPDVGGRLAKLRAEYHMRERIMQVLLIALLLHIVLWLLTQKYPESAVSWNWPLVVFFLSGFFISRWAAIRACHTFQRSVINHYIVLKNLSISVDKSIQPALWVRLDALRRDRSLLPAPSDSGKKPKGRKILVTKIDKPKEKEATEIGWEPPKDSGECPVQIMKDTEMAIFTDRTFQDRHCHKNATEIYTVLNGEMTIEIEHANYPLSTGDAIVVNAGAAHEVKSGKDLICQVISINCSGDSDKYLQ